MIEKLSNAYAPSGREEEVRQFIIDELSDFYKDIKIDSLGNLIVHKPGKKKIVALTAPMDEVGFVITHSENDKTVNSSSIGCVNQKTLHNIMVKDNDGNCYISSKDNKISDDTDKIRDFKFELIDSCKGDVLDTDLTSNTLVYDNFYRYFGKKCVGKALERSVCCSILSNLARSLADSLYEYYFIFTAYNYCDKKGAFTATHGLKIDELYNICGVDAEVHNLRSGPVAILRDSLLIASGCITDKIVKTDTNILVTTDLVCEGGIFQKQFTTSNVVSVGVPIKYLYSPNECVDLEDIENTYNYLYQAVLP